MTTPTIEEALAAFDHLTGIRQAKCCAESSETIRSALATAAQEQKAWREIEAWATEKTNRAFKLEISASGIVQKFRIGSTTYELDEDSGTRLAALVAAGEYCRAEREKR